MAPTITKPPRGAVLDRAHPLSRGLIGCWLLNEGTGSKLHDLSGGNNTGTFQNMDPQTDWVGGRDGFALDFDGVNDFVQWPATTKLIPTATNHVSCLIWIYLNVNPSGDFGGLVMGISNAHLYHLGVNNLEKIDWRVKDASIQAGSITVGKWTQLAGTNGGIGEDEVDAYIDGVRVGTASSSGAMPDSGEQLVLGRRVLGDARFIDAKFGLAMIWNRQISQADIISMRANPYQMFRTEASPGIFGAPAAAGLSIPVAMQSYSKRRK